MERLLRPKEACQLLGISYSTLLRWIREGKIRVVTTEGGKYRIPYSEIKKYLKRREETRAVIYARVSSADQKEDLERQINYLTNYATAKGYKVVEVLKDIASGLNTQRKGLLNLFKLVEERSIDVVLITYKDRLTRFGFEYIEEFFSTMGVKIEVIFGEEPKDATQELVEDLIFIITSFAGNGMRSHKKTLLVQGVKKLIGELSGEDDEVKG
ncbi:DNA binding domain protein, excisionase family [Sulfolobus islandicus Y.G.57.14]|uniref:DNA binding domain protein, excisionase family n=2 Tax=Saccharolobus islandicus TaxID=43080 RepID=C3NAB9_SACI7|nr:IS607 family transposase [Sulfolobus islandicus]ACP46712.1 DNA binding domain protein, excisionase family [Sulfolobus islandicus Y.G.57.14]ACP47599.1 DNA binding domain protein, excisionase family [Sulfolobus islandicus Y.N.15.51]